MEKKSRFISVRDFVIKSILGFLGVVVITSQVYPFIMKSFMLTDKEETFDSTEWYLLLIGFFLAVGGAYYHKIAEAIAKKFGGENRNKKSEKNDAKY